MDIREQWNKVNEVLEATKIASYLDVCNPLRPMYKEAAQIGIDIGSHSVKIAALKEMPNSVSVIKVGYKELAPSLDSGNSWQDTVLIEKELKTLIKECKIKDKRIALTISDTAVISQQINVPCLSELELLKAIRWRAEKFISFPLEQAVVDFQDLGGPVGHGAENKDVVLVVAHNDAINKYIALLRELKMVPTKVDITAFALIKAFLKTHTVEKDKMVALIDMGASRTVMAVVKDGKLLFLRSIDIAGNTFTSAIKDGLKIGFLEAEQIKKEQPLRPSGAGSNYGESALITHIETALTQLAAEINRSFAYCEAEILVERIEKAYLFGGGSLMNGIDSFLAEKLGVIVERGDIFKDHSVKMKKRDREAMHTMAPTVAAAFGAALL